MMIPVSLSSGVPQLQVQPAQSFVNSFWQVEHVQEHLRKLQETIDLVRATQKELELLLILRSTENNAEEIGLSYDNRSDKSSSLFSNDSILTADFECSRNDMHRKIYEMAKAKKICLNVQESLSLEVAKSLLSTLKNQLVPLNVITNQLCTWEEKSMAVRLAQKLQKSRRNKRWKKRKRRHIAELLHKEHKDYDKADREADEWRTREIAKDIARHKVENMKAIAKLKAIEEKKRLETELELVLVVEKLQELRSIRIQKLKKQGHFLPEEDDKFLERVRAAVEEEERQAAAAADTDAAKDAIATAEESRKAIHSSGTETKDITQTKETRNQDTTCGMSSEKTSISDADLQSERQDVDGQGSGMGYDSVSNLPPEFYHYYHGSTNDMGTLIEVRRMWDAYIRPGGSRIPGHWVQPPPPADDVWASYLVSRK